ncbi:hypothetical protein OIU84_021704 [Salix udensis]|uniref:Uncharacterized protein n=1 Tax=Salix udensis TaxID=889485 RepID=A0AAD6KV78_9ROSI|nr:hypothetical protein OIU84_021704 [Salix udensis]
MALLTNTLANICSVTNHISWANSTFMGGKLTGLYLNDSCQFLQGDKFCTRTFCETEISEKNGEGMSSHKTEWLWKRTDKGLEEERVLLSDKSSLEDDSAESVQTTVNNIASRSDVLQACTVTSGLIAALGILIRQVSHVASMEGLPILDCSTEVSFGIEMWHLELITGLVILISSCRYLLLNSWPDFAESSEAANQQVLTSLQPLDYVVVSFLPGVTEELLFRGALVPPLWNGLEECPASCHHIWRYTFGKWSEVLICCLGNLRWICLWLCYHCILKLGRTYGISCTEQSSWWALVATHIKASKIEISRSFFLLFPDSQHEH